MNNSESSKIRTPSKGNSSSSESSDDEEEAKKIAAAVGDNGIAQMYNGAVNRSMNQDLKISSKESNTGKPKVNRFNFSKRLAEIDVKSLKSNRPVDKNDDDKDNVLHTTPEFRAHIGKQLYQMLEKELSDSFVDGFWSLSGKVRDPHRGILLYSDSKQLFKYPPAEVEGQRKPSGNETKVKKRKIRLSSSSSSSDDDMISSCVFTARDIQQENDRLSSFEVTTGTMVTGQAGLKLIANSGECKEKKQSKSQTKDSNENSEINHKESDKTSAVINSEEGEPLTKKKKKKKKKKKLDESPEGKS